MDVVLYRNRNPVKRPPYVAAGPLPVERIGFGKGIGIDGKGGVKLVLLGADAHEVLLDQFTAGHAVPA